MLPLAMQGAKLVGLVMMALVVEMVGLMRVKVKVRVKA
jgi:hypothetical protein